MKILIALDENKNLDSKLSEHFGNCSFFAIYSTDSKNLEIIPNIIDHSKEKTPVEQIQELDIDAVFTKGIGKKAIDLFSKTSILLKTENFNILKEVIENIDYLKDIKQSCDH
ncbi:MAG: NifB/NifX family molybdenum-iron cluster-binding protein [Candidatus ainarchaeum sp.]|nr:NifB/NifX family molybdenum-iron cluster-binding protein [Candidatus ainarchaeum sp.]MDD3976114.1 NifB/NifX family molybdenum-iron cluster-binding protein [Candidatus ainarchaeum sp.]